MYEHVGGGKLVLRFVVVGDDQFEAKRPCHVCLGHAGDATINGDDERGTGLGDAAQRLGIEPVAFIHAVRDVVIGRAAQQAQSLPEHARCR